MPYKLEYLPAARQDILDMVRYVSTQLQNPSAAARLAERLVAAAENARRMPYAHPAYLPLRPLRHAYRRILVGKYLLFYWVTEETQTITVARVLYAKRDLPRLLD